MPYPILKRAGQTLWFVFLSTGAHKFRYLSANASPAKFPRSLGGPMKAFVAGIWTEVPAAAELGIRVVRASFGGGVTRVPLTGLNLGGGIDSVDIVAPAILPAGTDLKYEVQIGGATYAIDEPSGAHPLAGQPSSLPLTAIFSFTDAVAPVLDIAPIASGGAYARLAKAGTSLLHVSATRSPPVPVSTVQESVVIEGWDGAANTLSAHLLTGAGFATVTSPSTTVDEVQADGSLKRTWTWVGLSSVTAHKVRQTGGTTDQTKVFSERQANWSAAA